MLKLVIKSVKIKKRKRINQDEIFRKMSVDEKLPLLDEFFRFGKELQNLNDRKREQIKR